MRHRDLLDRARRAWALSAATYREIERTQAGVIQGALFLLAMMIPFAHFAERLLFGFADLRSQVLGYFAVFLAGFAALRCLHPAFELSISPVIILLGFVILALGILVTSLGMARLNRELQELGGRRQGHATVIAQIVAKRFHPSLYWMTIVASTTFGTTMAGFADRSIGIVASMERLPSLQAFLLLLSSISVTLYETFCFKHFP